MTVRKDASPTENYQVDCALAILSCRMCGIGPTRSRKIASSSGLSVGVREAWYMCGYCISQSSYEHYDDS